MNLPTLPTQSRSVVIVPRKVVADKRGLDVLNKTIQDLDKKLKELEQSQEVVAKLLRHSDSVLANSVEMAVKGHTGKEIGMYILESMNDRTFLTEGSNENQTS